MMFPLQHNSGFPVMAQTVDFQGAVLRPCAFVHLASHRGREMQLSVLNFPVK